jgi:hypothetical protein
MESNKFGEPKWSGEAESLLSRRQRLAYVYIELRTAVADLIESGAAQDGHTQTPELLRAETLGERLRGEPIRGTLRGRRYYLDDQPRGYLSVPRALPHGFNEPTVLGIFEGAVKMHKVLENAELVIGISPLASTDNEAIKAFYQNDNLAKARLHQPLGLRKQDLDQRLWLPAVDFEFTTLSVADDYLTAEIARSERFRAIIRHQFPPEQPPEE